MPVNPCSPLGNLFTGASLQTLYVPRQPLQLYDTMNVEGGDVTLDHLRCRLDPVHVERVSIRDALGGLSGLKRGGLSSLWSKVELIEPTFQVCQPLVLPL